MEKKKNDKIIVIKKNGREQVFSKAKIKAGIIKACDGRRKPITKINELVIEINKYAKKKKKIKSKEIGERVVKGLMKIDKNISISFKSVFQPKK